MADNRIYLYCPACGESAYIAKCMGGPDYYRTDDETGGDLTAGHVVLNFLRDHFWCGGYHEARQVELRWEVHPLTHRELPI